MDKKDFYLSALVDFPDDVLGGLVTRENLVDLFKKLKECNVKRIFWYYYGEDDDSYYSNSKNPGERYKNLQLMLSSIKGYNSFAVKTAHEMGMEIVGVIRTSESGNAKVYSDFYPEARAVSEKVKSLGGVLLSGNKYLRAHPEARIKRRSYDINIEAEGLNVSRIELHKQNDLPTEIKKEDLRIYVSENNYGYTEYKGDFSFSVTKTVCPEDTYVVAGGSYTKKRITKAQDEVTTIVLSGLDILEPFVAVTCNRGVSNDPENSDLLFKNTLARSISCYSAEGIEIPISVANKARVWCDPEGRDFREVGLDVDSGFGDYFEYLFDGNNQEGLIGFAKGKNRYVHSHLCECDEGVREYWLSQLEKCIDCGFDMITNREENHSLMMNEPFAYGYNDSIKERYFKEFGKTSEVDMDTEKIAKVRGDAYTELFKEGAKRIKLRDGKVALMINLEMLHEPIALERIFAYPMNVQWQWRRWLREIPADEVVVRTYRYTPQFVFSDPQCLEILKEVKALGLPMTYERYIDSGYFASEYELIRNSGMFDSITLYETAELFRFDKDGKILIKKPELFEALKNKK